MAWGWNFFPLLLHLPEDGKRAPFSGCNFPNFQWGAHSLSVLRVCILQCALRAPCHKNNLSRSLGSFSVQRLGGEFTSCAVSAAFAVLCFFNLVPCIAFEVWRDMKTHTACPIILAPGKLMRPGQNILSIGRGELEKEAPNLFFPFHTY